MSPPTELPERRRAAAIVRLWARDLILILILGGGMLAAHAETPAPQRNGVIATDLEVAQNQAKGLNQPLLLLVAESGASRNDDHARDLMTALAARELHGKAVVLNLDLAVSRNRAIAARFHVTNTPALFCISPRGIIISRDDEKINRKLVLQQTAIAERQSPAVDAEFARLETAAADPASGIKGQFALADFLLSHHNASEAMPTLESLAHSGTNSPRDRVAAWVALARAHLWTGEPEKCRHEAEKMIAELAQVLPEARAAGMLVIGAEDISVHPALAPGELHEAVAAAPDSAPGREAASVLAKLYKKQK